MRNITTKAKAGWLILAMLALSAAGCGGSSTSSSSPATVSLTGSWSVTETVLTASGVCEDEVGTGSTWTADVVQSGNDITVTITSGDLAGTVYTGSISGDDVDWQRSYSDQGGTTTVTGADITATNTSLTGTASWEWTDGTDSCSGTTRVTGSKS